MWGKNVKLRWKTLGIVVITIVSLVGILFIVSQIIMQKGVADMEQKITSQDINRVLETIDNELSNLNATTLDYAAWDDTYAFIQDNNTDYINANLVNTTCINLRLNFMLFFNSTDKLVIGKAVNLQNGSEIPVPQGLLEHFGNDSFLLHHTNTESSATGIVLLPEGPILVASRPILTSQYEGPIRGALVTGRFFDALESSYLFRTTLVPLILQEINSSPISPDFQKANTSLSKESPIFIQSLNDKRIAGYALLEDVHGNPVLILRADMPRDLYAQGQASILYVILSLVAVGVVFGTLTMLLLERFVLSRLSRLSTDVGKISKSGDLSARVSVVGKDELSSLSEEINGMLSALGQTGETLCESEVRFRRITENMLDLVSQIDMKGVFQYVSPSHKRALGYDSEYFIGKSIFDLMHPDDINRVKEAILESVCSHSWGMLEFRYKHADGHYLWFEGTANFLVDDKGEVIGAVISTRDITERKNAEKALLESQQKFERLFKNQPDPTIFADLNDHFLDVNPRFAEVFGYSPDEVRGKAVDDLLVPEDRKTEAQMLTKKGMEEYVSYETIRKRKDGSLIPVSISAAPIIVKGQFTGNVVTYKDVTERQKMEEALRESEERLRQLIEYAPDAIYMNDLNGTFLDGNKQVELMIGYKKEELVGRNLLEAGVLLEKYAQKSIEDLMKNSRGERSGPDEYELKRKDGDTIWAEISTFPVKRGEKIEVMGIARDITQRKQMQRKLEEYSQQLEVLVEKRTRQLKETQEQLVKAERLATIGQVAAMVGHDLRNPLTGISGAAYYLKTKLGPKDDRKITEMLEFIEKDIQYSNKIITDLMEYSREIRLELTETTPKSIIAEALSVVQIPEKVQLLDETENEPKIKIDIDKMKRVFGNLIKNALEAMPQGGKLTVSSRTSDGNIEFIFTDSGTGMAKEVLGRIWTPFFTTKAKGMGLGLAICKRIIEAHQGKIYVESVVGEGTTFAVTVPLEPKPKADGGEKVWVNLPESLLSTTTKASEQS